MVAGLDEQSKNDCYDGNIIKVIIQIKDTIQNPNEKYKKVGYPRPVKVTVPLRSIKPSDRNSSARMNFPS